ncbi:MAG: hypothetical protein GY810_06950 [Aureispira sp.]|nr:hypothetical protein [Aureispira sp.]
MQKIITLLLSLALANTSLFAEDMSIREAINKSAHQSMLAQQIAKVYLALNDNDRVPEYYQERDAAIEQFTNQLQELRNYRPTPQITHAWEEVDKQWESYKAIADWAINEEGAIKLLSQSDNMLDACNKLVSAYEQYAKEISQGGVNDFKELASLVETAGTQRMRLQRLMLYYLAVKQNIDKKTSERKLSTTINSYDAALKKLEVANDNSNEINVELKGVQSDWDQLKSFLGDFDVDNDYIANMMTLTKNQTISMDGVARMYQDLGSVLSISKLLNMSSHLHMLTQRIAKDYAAITYGYKAGKYRVDLSYSINLFEEQLQSLEVSAQTEDIKRSAGVVKIMWKNYRTMAKENPEDNYVGRMIEQSHIILAACDRLVKQIKEHAETIPEYQSLFEKDGQKVAKEENIAQLIDLAGSQRMHTQKLGLYFMLSALGKDSNVSGGRLKESLSGFSTAFETMKTSKLNSPSLIKELHSMHSEWKLIENRCENIKKGDISELLETIDTLLEKTEDVTKAYQEKMDELLLN